MAGQALPARCSRGAFERSSLINIGAFRLAGYFTWNEEAAGSNPVSYTVSVVQEKICSSNGQDARFSFLEYGFDSRTDYKVRWCNG